MENGRNKPMETEQFSNKKFWVGCFIAVFLLLAALFGYFLFNNHFKASDAEARYWGCQAAQAGMAHPPKSKNPYEKEFRRGYWRCLRGEWNRPRFSFDL